MPEQFTDPLVKDTLQTVAAIKRNTAISMVNRVAAGISSASVTVH